MTLNSSDIFSPIFKKMYISSRQHSLINRNTPHRHTMHILSMELSRVLLYKNLIAEKSTALLTCIVCYTHRQWNSAEYYCTKTSLQKNINCSTNMHSVLHTTSMVLKSTTVQKPHCRKKSTTLLKHMKCASSF